MNNRSPVNSKEVDALPLFSPTTITSPSRSEVLTTRRRRCGSGSRKEDSRLRRTDHGSSSTPLIPHNHHSRKTGDSPNLIPVVSPIRCTTIPKFSGDPQENRKVSVRRRGTEGRRGQPEALVGDRLWEDSGWKGETQGFPRDRVRDKKKNGVFVWTHGGGLRTEVYGRRCSRTS